MLKDKGPLTADDGRCETRSMVGRLRSDFGKQIQKMDHCFDAVIEIGQVKFFVRRVGAVIGQTESDHHHGGIQYLNHIVDDRQRTPAS